ncbi:hypothetical protein CANARDRAFT_26179 [[Candida] arabinofermentans NRRL YB-2248]|uniref:Choline kinase N-terminal domain-containing protein n=1 Tax=[Candida] arabinofermentans NRRL YB-2248 TaxID=983967 RepID=A0A1E4T8E1_9ASCO|nr:hypothetical protein CANARDRAFT_26179 [[Candida] arabinofermentans NRRL YB-2248]
MERPKYIRKYSSSSNVNARRRSTSRKHRRRRSSSSHSVHAPLGVDLNNYDSAGTEDVFELELNEIKASLDNTLPLDYFKQDIISVLQNLRIPKWRKIQISESSLQQLELKRISGALTNSVYKVTYKNYYPLLLRLYGANVENIIDRESELITLLKLSQKNIGPKLLGCFTNGRFEEFLNNSITLNKNQIREPKVSRMIARRMKELHNGIPLAQTEKLQGSKAWLLIEKWVKLVDEIVEGSTLEEQKKVFLTDWESFKKLIFSYQEWLYHEYGGKINVDEKLKFCHNDTQYGNLLFYNKADQRPINDEDEDEDSALGSSSSEMNLVNKTAALSLNSSTTSLPLVQDLNYKDDKKLVVIDFEYAGPNLPAYDITNHFSEWMSNYHHPTMTHLINYKLYPTKEERLNLLNTYVNYVPGSHTPRMLPRVGSSTTVITELSLTNARTASVVTLMDSDLPEKVVRLYNECIYWRACNSIFWGLWGVITRGSIKTGVAPSEMKDIIEVGPNGETYRVISTNDDEVDMEDDDDEINEDVDDDSFDYLGYSEQKNMLVIGDLIQLGLLIKENVDEEILKKAIYLDTELLKL